MSNCVILELQSTDGYSTVPIFHLTPNGAAVIRFSDDSVTETPCSLHDAVDIWEYVEDYTQSKSPYILLVDDHSGFPCAGIEIDVRQVISIRYNEEEL